MAYTISETYKLYTTSRYDSLDIMQQFFALMQMYKWYWFGWATKKNVKY